MAAGPAKCTRNQVLAGARNLVLAIQSKGMYAAGASDNVQSVFTNTVIPFLCEVEVEATK